MIKTSSHLTPILAVAFLALSSKTGADEAPPSPPKAPSGTGLILSAGVGPGSAGLVGLMSLQARRHARLVGLRLASSTTSELFEDSPSPSDTEYSMLYGRYAGGKAGCTSASAGLSLVSSVRRGRLLGTSCVFLFGCHRSYEKVVSRTIGLPFEAKAVLSTRFAGLGLSLMGNLNAKGSYVGAALIVELGSLR